MQLAQGLAQPVKGSRGRLDQQQAFAGSFDLAFPPVDRFHLRHDVDARRKLPVNQSLSNASPLVERAAGSHHNACVGHMRISFRFRFLATTDAL